ncbi:MAG: hypothetical protein H0Z33_15310 [Bacillaceae bacterium]|nr:hypothetical protein [Bacillaceae bacterium]
MLPDILSLGPFMIRASWLALIIGGLAGLVLFKYRAKAVVPEQADTLENILSNSMILFVVVWKFSPALTSPSLLWTQPSALLFMSPGSLHVWLGLVTGLLFFAFRIYRSRISWKQVLDLTSYFWSTILLIYFMLIPEPGLASQLPWAFHYKGSQATFHPVHIYLALTALIILINLYRRRDPIGDGKAAGESLFVLGVGGLITSFFQAATDTTLGLTGFQWFSLGMLVISYLIQRQNKA